VAEDCAVSHSQHCGHPLPLVIWRGVPDGVDAAVEAMEATRSVSFEHGVDANPHLL
jgi:hypothetical protein